MLPYKSLPSGSLLPASPEGNSTTLRTGLGREGEIGATETLLTSTKQQKKYKQTENNSQPPKSTINSLPNPQAPGTWRQRRGQTLGQHGHVSVRARTCRACQWRLQRCHAGSGTCMDMGTRVCRRERARSLCPELSAVATGWPTPGSAQGQAGQSLEQPGRGDGALPAAGGRTGWASRCSQPKPVWDSVTASAPSEETLPHLHPTTSSFLPAQPTGQAWLPAGVVWHQKAPVTGVAGAMGAGQPATLHLPTQELPAGARGSTGALACLAQP